MRLTLMPRKLLHNMPSPNAVGYMCHKELIGCYPAEFEKYIKDKLIVQNITPTIPLPDQTPVLALSFNCNRSLIAVTTYTKDILMYNFESDVPFTMCKGLESLSWTSNV